MHRGNRYVASIFLTAAFMAPISVFATPVPQDDHERHEERERRVYDPYHKEWTVEKGEFEISAGSSSADIRLKSITRFE